MDFEIKSKDKDGNIVFEGTASAAEASFLLTMGVSYLLAQGVAPMLKGAKFEGATLEEPQQMQ